MDGGVPELYEWLAHQHGVPPRRVASRRPHFLVVAAPKTGSTWLADNLRRHPEVFVPDIKEVKYFSSLGRWVGLDWYLGHFDAGGGKTRGEASPSYAALPSGRIRLARALFPDLKLVFLLRDPVARAWSHARHTRRFGEAAFGGAPLDEAPVDWQAAACHEWVTASGDYLGHLRRWLSAFPREQVLVRFHEEIADRPEALFRDVLAFLGVDPSLPLDGFPLRERINASPALAVPEAVRAALHRLWHGRTRELAAFLRNEFGLATPPAWRATLDPPAGGCLGSAVFAPAFEARLQEMAALEETFPSGERHLGYQEGFHLWLRRGRLEADGHGVLLEADDLPGLGQKIGRHLAEAERSRQEAAAREAREAMRALEARLAQALEVAQRADQRSAALERSLHEAGLTVQHLERQMARMRPWWRVAGRWLADACKGARGRGEARPG